MLSQKFKGFYHGLLARDELIFIDRATGSQSPAIRAYDPNRKNTLYPASE
jgi:hypothetical protein